MHKQYGAFFDLSDLPATVRTAWRRHLGAEDEGLRADYWRFLIMKHAASLEPDSLLNNSAHFKRLFRIGRVALTERDAHDLEIIDERAFALRRALKVLEVTLPLKRGEKVYAKYAKAFLKASFPNNRLKTLATGELLLTNQRCLIVEGSAITHAFEWKKTKVSLDSRARLEHAHQIYEIWIYDDLTLVMTLRNLLARKVRHDH